MSLIDSAYAMGTPPAGGNAAAGSSAGGSIIGSLGPFFPLLLIIVIFYIFLWMPQKKERKKQQEKIAALKKGDKIISTGGLHGIVANAAGDPIKVKIADNVKVDMSRSAIAVIDPAKEESKEV
jgi:preprotein translocase subunit YajC